MNEGASAGEPVCLELTDALELYAAIIGGGVEQAGLAGARARQAGIAGRQLGDR